MGLLFGRSSQFIGFVGLDVPRWEARFTPCVEVGWRLAYAHWGRGYATEAARAAIVFGFRELKLAEIVLYGAGQFAVTDRDGAAGNDA